MIEEEWIWSLRKVHREDSQLVLVAYTNGGLEEMRIFADGETPRFKLLSLPPVLSETHPSQRVPIEERWNRAGANLILYGPGGICGRFLEERSNGRRQLALWAVADSARERAKRAGIENVSEWICLHSEEPLPARHDVLFRD